jgi:hypothetical protein
MAEQWKILKAAQVRACERVRVRTTDGVTGNELLSRLRPAQLSGAVDLALDTH